METTAPLPFLSPQVLYTVLCQRKATELGTQLIWPVGLFLAYFVLQSKTKLEFNCGQNKVIHITESENLTFLWTITHSSPFSKAVLGFYILRWGLFSQTVVAVSFKQLSIEQLLFNKNQWHYFGESGMLMISSCYTPITRQPFSPWFHEKTHKQRIHDAGCSVAPEGFDHMLNTCGKACTSYTGMLLISSDVTKHAKCYVPPVIFKHIIVNYGSVLKGSVGVFVVFIWNCCSCTTRILCHWRSAQCTGRWGTHHSVRVCVTCFRHWKTLNHFWGHPWESAH